MAQKKKKKQYVLRELLSEEQEPFLLRAFISEKQSQLQSPISNSTKSQSFGILGSFFKKVRDIIFDLSHSDNTRSRNRLLLTSSSVTEDQEIGNNGADSINKFQLREEEELEEEKKQCSPVSVLDPPFEDDDVHGNESNDYYEDDDLECSYANVQRTEQQLLYRLHRFEKLANLDQLELEKRMLDQEDEYGTIINEEDDCEDDNSEASYVEKNSRTHGGRRFAEDLKRLVSDLIAEEHIREHDTSDDMDIVMERVCRRLELWEEVDSNTIDMMVDDDFSREEGLWKKNAQQVGELAWELEVAIFGFLVEEFTKELGS